MPPLAVSAPQPTQTRPSMPLGLRIRALQVILGKLVPVPEQWLLEGRERSKNNRPNGMSSMECIPCNEYKELIVAWRHALKWTDGLDRALSVMLASITSTKTVGDQLWLKIIGPAACGKSTLCEAVSVARTYVLPKSTIRGFHSGFKTDGNGKEDNSLISKLYNKTLVTKDGDTLLQSPNLGQVLSEARDIYDGTSRTHYRNTMSKDYDGIRMTWLLCGTSSLRSIDSSELGERFLDCVIMDGIDDELEDEILWRVANKASRSATIESNGKAESTYEPEMAKGMAMTGGYVEYLRENAIELLKAVSMDENALRKCTKLGKFVSYLRARPSLKQQENAERELAARLVSQHIRLAKCLAVVLNKNKVDEEVMKRVGLVALDTGRGQTMDIARTLYHTQLDGLETRTISYRLNCTMDNTRKLLRFLGKIGVVTTYQPEVKGIRKKARWKLTDRLYRLYAEVVES